MDLLDRIEILAVLFAAAVHDVDHPGMNNSFLSSTGDPLALLYNDRSPLENHHLATAFELARNYQTFSEMDDVYYRHLRRLVIHAVLATDLKEHFASLGVFRTSISR